MEGNLWLLLIQIKNALQTFCAACAGNSNLLNKQAIRIAHTHSYSSDTFLPTFALAGQLQFILLSCSWQLFPHMFCNKLPPIKFISLKTFHLIFIDFAHMHMHPHPSSLPRPRPRPVRRPAVRVLVPVSFLFLLSPLICRFITYTPPITKRHVGSLLLN